MGLFVGRTASTDMDRDACCKVGRVVREHDLGPPSDRAADLDEYLAARWRGVDGYEESGLRPLAAWFNRHLLRAAYYRHGRAVYDTKINAEYETLSGAAGDRAERAELLADLETDGIDGEALADDFVSRSTLARHLGGCLGVEKGRSAPDPDSDWETDRIRISREQFRENLHKPLRSLAGKGRLAGADEADLDTPIVLSCPHCPTRVRFERALEQGYVCPDHLGDGAADGANDA